MALELIDTQTTDSNGEASITYTGAGAGEIEFRAKVSTLLQETYGIGDYLFWDNGVDENTNWLNTGVTVSRDSTGALLTNNSNTNYFYRANKPGTSSDQYDWEAPFVVEYDVVSITNAGNVLSYIYDGVNENLIKTMASNTLGVTDGSHVRITYDGETCHMFVDDVEKYNISLESTRKFQIGWRINNATLKYKNFKIYSAI